MKTRSGGCGRSAVGTPELVLIAEPARPAELMLRVCRPDQPLRADGHTKADECSHEKNCHIHCIELERRQDSNRSAALPPRGGAPSWLPIAGFSARLELALSAGEHQRPVQGRSTGLGAAVSKSVCLRAEAGSSAQHRWWPRSDRSRSIARPAPTVPSAALDGLLAR